MISKSLENPLYLFANDSTLCLDIPHPFDRQAASSSLTSDLEKNHKLVKHLEYVFKSWQISHSHYLSLKGPFVKKKKPHPLSQQSSWGSSVIQTPGLTISHDLSWASHISKLASKASHQMGILSHTKSLIGTPECISTYKAFIHSVMEYCSPIWAGSPASHLAQLDAM